MSAPLYETRAIPGKGIGVFATQHIPHGTLIIADDSILPTPEENEINPIALYAAFSALPSDVQAEYLTLAHPSDEEKIGQYEQWATDYNASSGSQAIPASALLEAARVAAIFETNALSIQDREPAVAVICLEVARINHSCMPNAHHQWDEAARRRNVYATVDVPAGEEVTIAYLQPLLGRNLRLHQLRQQYGFDCDCKACDLSTGFGVASARRRKEMQKLDLSVTEAWDVGVYHPTVPWFTTILALMEQEGLHGPSKVHMHTQLSMVLQARGGMHAAIAEKGEAVKAAVYCSGEESVLTRQQRQELANLKAGM